MWLQVSREEAATFLREIRQSITILQNYYAERKAEQQAVEQEALVSNQNVLKQNTIFCAHTI